MKGALTARRRANDKAVAEQRLEELKREQGL